MARPRKQTADYFPHDATPGKTLFVLESRYGVGGYAAWFKLLQLLCRTPGHYYKVATEAEMAYLSAETGLMSTETTTSFIDDCVVLGALDRDLWQFEHGIWSQHLVDNLADMYKRRKTESPNKPLMQTVTELISTETQLNHTENDKGNKIKVNNNKRNNKRNKTNNKTILDKTRDAFKVFWEAYPKKKSKGHAEKVFSKINPDEQLLATMLATIEQAKKSDDWLKESGQFIPHPATWLNKKCWEDEIKPAKEVTHGYRPEQGRSAFRDIEND